MQSWNAVSKMIIRTETLKIFLKFFAFIRWNFSATVLLNYNRDGQKLEIPYILGV